MIKPKFISIFFSLVFLFSSVFIYANEDDFFGLPSPSEILMDAESEGLKIILTKKNSKVLRTNLEELAKKSKYETAFAMGRIFSIAGFSFKKLRKDRILQLASKMYVGTAALKLPAVINNEITGYYTKMLRNPKWERSELMIFFTSARSSLMYLMKDKKKVKEEEYPMVQSIACALELGMWFQGLSLALENLKPEQAENYGNVFIDEDVLNYFDKSLKESLKFKKYPQLFDKLANVNNYTLEMLKDEKVDMAELEKLKTKLSEVIK
jgi:hypothetical protein